MTGNLLRAWGWLMLTAAMLCAYVAPWLSAGSASLTFGGYDLAEWTSLHPSVRGGTPPLLTTLWLRLPLACIALLPAFALSRSLRGWRRGLPALLVIVISVGLLPPFEFFTFARDDPNYRQQFGLALLALVAGLLGVSERLGQLNGIIAVAAALVGAGCSITGLAQSATLMNDFRLEAVVGAGGIALAALFVVAAALLLPSLRATNKQGSLRRRLPC